MAQTAHPWETLRIGVLLTPCPPTHARLQGCATRGLFLFYPISNRHLHICVGGNTVPRKLALGVVGQAADTQVCEDSPS